MALTNEDLLAISQLLDVKLKAEIQPIKNEIQSVKAELQAEIQSVKAELQAEIQSVKAELQAQIQSVEAELQAQIHKIEVFQKEVLLLRLDTIESCYLSTYYRYKDSVEGYEALQADNAVMKAVIMEHSDKLQKLA